MQEQKSANPFLRGMDSFLSVLGKAEIALAILAFTLMLIDVLAGVVMRYILYIPFPWGEEAARYLMVTGIMMGIGYGLRDGAHLNVELVRAKLPKMMRNVVIVVADMITLAAFLLLVSISWNFIEINRDYGQLTASLNIPIYYIYYILLIGFVLSAIEQAAVMIKRYTSGFQGTQAEEMEDIV